jgi:Spy/CpxP family protein refolding chaperone
MRRTRGWAVAFFVTVAAAGVAVGVAADRLLLREGRDQQSMRARLADEIGMDAAQRIQLDSVLDARNRSYDLLMAPVRPRLDSLGVLTRQRIRQLLTPEQQANYDQMLRERDEARRQEKQR